MDNQDKLIVVVGGTGRQGKEVTRQLLKDSWKVRVMTRNPSGNAALALSRLGAEVAQADLDDKASVDSAFQGAYGVYTVLNPISGKMEIEIRQGKTVADAAKRAGIEHLVYAAAGSGKVTGIEQWDSKIEIINHMQELGLPITILRLAAFMELMVDPAFHPESSTWHIMPKLMGSNRKMPWNSVQDIGVIAAKMFADPDKYIGADLTIVTDAKSVDECRTIYEEVMGKKPPHFPMPLFLFKLFAGQDIPRLWKWLGENDVSLDTTQAREIYPEAMTVREWLETVRTKAE